MAPIIFHYRKRDSFLCKTNPLTKLLSLALLSIGLSNTTFYPTLLFLTLLFAIAIVTKLTLSSYRREFTFFLFMGAFILITEYWSTRAMLSSVNATIRFLAYIMLGIIFADTTDADDLSRCLAPVLDKIPFVKGGEAASTITLTLSLIPLFFDIADETLDAQRSRLSNVKHPIRYLVDYVSTLFDSLLDASASFADGLDARLFNADAIKKGLPFSIRDLILLSVTILLFIGGKQC
jgi:biotin transport system permease protein